MTRLFVYGTLKKNFHAHELMDGAAYVGEAVTSPAYRIFNMGGFPGMVPGGDGTGGGVHGELYDVNDDAVLKRLHKYECIDSGLFRFEEIELNDGQKVWAYLFNRTGERFAVPQLLEDGVWP